MNSRYLLAFALTFLIELPIVLFMQRRWSSRPWLSVSWDVLLVNACSHPLAVYCAWSWHWPFWVLEGLVTLLEALLYRQLSELSWKRAFLLSLLANLPTALMSFCF